MHRGVLDRIELNLTGDDAVGAAVEAQIVHGRQEFAAANGQAQILEVEGNVLRLALIAVEHAGHPTLATDRPRSPLAGARTRGRFDLTGLSHGDQLLMENEAGPCNAAIGLAAPIRRRYSGASLAAQPPWAVVRQAAAAPNAHPHAATPPKSGPVAQGRRGPAGPSKLLGPRQWNPVVEADAAQADRCWAGHPAGLLLAKSVDTDDLVFVAGIAAVGLGGHDLGPGNGTLGPRRLEAFVGARLARGARLLFELARSSFDGIGIRRAQRLAGKIGIFELQAVG